MQTSQKDLYKKILGRSGEIKARKFLKKEGYTVLERNYKTHVGEIDIIAEKDGVTVFVEVKTRKDDSYGSPSEAVNYEKRIKYAKVANEYLIRNGKTDSECRFDVIEIQNDEINHIIDAFCV